MDSYPSQPWDSSALDDEIHALEEQIATINDFHENQKAKYRADALPDHEVARQVFLEEARTHHTYLTDLKMARRMAYADGAAQPNHTGPAERHRHEEITRLIYEPSGRSNTNPDDEEHAQRVASLLSYVFSESEVAEPTTRSSRLTGPVPVHRRRVQHCHRCGIIEREDVVIIRMECRHSYCERCLRQMSRAGAGYNTFVSPSCCGRMIDSDRVRGIIGPIERLF